MTRDILLFLGGVGVLYFGAEWLVRGSARLAASLGVSPIVVGLTVVSLGTSAPELVISVVASLGGSPDLAIGNVMGSNLANVGLVLGISAIVRPLHVSARVVTREVPVMILITVALLPLIWDLYIGRLDGLVLLTMLVAYLAFVLHTAKAEGTEPLDKYEESTDEAVGISSRTIARDTAFILLGVAGLSLAKLGHHGDFLGPRDHTLAHGRHGGAERPRQLPCSPGPRAQQRHHPLFAGGQGRNAFTPEAPSLRHPIVLPSTAGTQGCTPPWRGT